MQRSPHQFTYYETTPVLSALQHYKLDDLSQIDSKSNHVSYSFSTIPFTETTQNVRPGKQDKVNF